MYDKWSSYMVKYTALLFLFLCAGISHIQAEPKPRVWQQLITAVVENNSAYVQQVLDSKAIDIHEQSPLGTTLLGYATYLNRPDIVTLCLQHGAKINDKIGANKRTPLHYAAENDNDELAELLISHSAYCDAEDGRCRTPLHDAAKHNSTAVARVLLKHNASVEGGMFPQMDKSSKYNWGRTPLHEAAYSNSTDVVQLLISAKADIHARDGGGCTPLHEAASSNSKEAAEILLNNGADIRALAELGGSPMHSAAEHNSCAIIDFFADKYPEVVNSYYSANNNATSATPLIAAIRAYNKEAVQALLNHNATINVPDKKGLTPLHHAADCHDLEITRLLLQYTPDVWATTIDNNTALDIQLGYINHATALDIALRHKSHVGPLLYSYMLFQEFKTLKHMRDTTSLKAKASRVLLDRYNQPVAAAEEIMQKFEGNEYTELQKQVSSQKELYAALYLKKWVLDGMSEEQIPQRIQQLEQLLPQVLACK